MTATISRRLHGAIPDAFFSGSPGPQGDDVPFRAQVAIGSHPYQIVVEKYRRSTLPLQRQPVDESVEPGEQSLNSAGLWRRSQDNWFLGAGQEYLDNRFAFVSVYTVSGQTPSVRTRFWRSKGINPWGEGVLSLLPETQQKVASANANLTAINVNGDLYRVDGTEAYWTADPTPASPSWTAAGIQSGQTPVTVRSVTTDGFNLYAALGANGITKTVSRGTTSTVLTAGGTYAATLVGYANGHLIASTGRDLVEISAAGAVTPIWTHPNPNFVWDGIRPGPNGIYVYGHAGVIGDVMVITLASTGALNVPYLACTLDDGELVNDLRYYDSLIILATNLGIRACPSPDASTAVFQSGPAIVGLGPSQCLAPYGEFVWFGTSNYSTVDDIDPAPGVTTSGLGRCDPRQFTSDSVPAWALDVQTTDGIGGTVTSAAVVGTRRYFTVAGNGLWGEDANVVASGTLETGWIRYGTTEPKILVYLSEADAPLVGSITLRAYGETGTLLTTQTNTTFGSTGPPTDWAVGLVVGEQFMVSVTLNRDPDDHTQSPQLRRWTAKAQVLAARQDEIIVPLRLHTREMSNRGEGDPMWQDPKAEFAYLQNLMRTGAITLYTEGIGSEPVYVDQLELAPEKWNDTYSFFEGICTVRLVTLA